MLTTSVEILRFTSESALSSCNSKVSVFSRTWSFVTLMLKQYGSVKFSGKNVMLIFSNIKSPGATGKKICRYIQVKHCNLFKACWWHELFRA